MPEVADSNGGGPSAEKGFRILIVDDEPNVLAAFRRQLFRRYDIQTAGSGDEALQCLGQDNAIAVMVADMRMPGMDGVTLLRECRLRVPDVVRIMLTGNADQATAIKAVNEGQVFRFLTKPCSSEQLCSVLDAAISHYRLNRAERSLLAQAEVTRQALIREQQLNTMQRKFLSMISHELRTPLAIIDSAIELLGGGYNLTEEQVGRRITQIKNAVRRLNDMVEGTLDSVRFEEGRFDFLPKPCDLGALVEVVCQRQREIAPEHLLLLERDAAPEAFIGDQRLLDHVVSNLISNAVKYSQSHQPVCVQVYAESETAIIQVKDQGIGIPAEDIPLLFQRFFRATTATGIPGTGLGLHLVQQLVQLHGGSVDVTSLVGQGSTFTVRLPIKRPVLTAPTQGQETVE